MKYKVLKTCTAGNRGKYCKEGDIVSFTEEITNKYLEPVGNKAQVTTKPKKDADQKPLSSLGKKPELKTGMAAKRKDKEEVK